MLQFAKAVLKVRRSCWLILGVVIGLTLMGCMVPYEIQPPVPPATKPPVTEPTTTRPPHPTPDAGYELTGYKRIVEGEVTDYWGKQIPSKEGYDWSEAVYTTGQGKFTLGELITYLYDPVGVTKTIPLSFTCPEPKEGFELVGFSRVSNFQVVEHWGKWDPRRGGYITIGSKTEVRDYKLVLDEIIACIYDPVVPVSEKLKEVVEYHCPPPESGYKLVGFTYVKNFVVQNYWGKGKASREGYVHVKSKTVVKGGATGTDEIWTCVYEPADKKFPDLVIESVIITTQPVVVPTPSPVYAGETATAFVIVKNVGDAVASNFVVSFEIPDLAPKFYRESVPLTLAPGQSTTLTFSCSFPSPGTYNVHAFADPYDAVEEWDDMDNGESISLEVGRKR